MSLIAYYTAPPETIDVTQGESAEYGTTRQNAQTGRKRNDEAAS
jgi:hypothetical protein